MTFARPPGWGPPKTLRLRDAEVAYRTFGAGDGPNVLFVHGWPFWSASFRALIPRLEGFRCICPDTAGLGETICDAGIDLGFRAQAERLRAFIDALGLDRIFVVAHDTGATIARLEASTDDRVQGMVLLNTEMPGHRPPYVQLYQRLLALPGATRIQPLLMRSRRYLRSSLAFGGCFDDPARIDDEFVRFYIDPLVRSQERTRNAVAYLRGIDWQVVDEMTGTHGRIDAPVRLVWGADDPTFPVARARVMVDQFARGMGITEIPRARLLVHEERPDEVAAAIRGTFEPLA